MKKKIKVTIAISSILFIIFAIMEINIYKLAYEKNKSESVETLRYAYEQIDKKSEISGNKQFDVKENDVIGILVIPKLQVEAPVKEGTSQEIMKTSVGHFIESDYWNGNVSFASHNSGTSMHFFENINMLDINDEIEYITEYGERKYKVKSIDIIEDTDWSMVVKNNEKSENRENTITLITCINGQPNYRLCVRGVEIN